MTNLTSHLKTLKVKYSINGSGKSSQQLSYLTLKNLPLIIRQNHNNSNHHFIKPSQKPVNNLNRFNQVQQQRLLIRRQARFTHAMLAKNSNVPNAIGITSTARHWTFTCAKSTRSTLRTA